MTSSKKLFLKKHHLITNSDLTEFCQKDSTVLKEGDFNKLSKHQRWQC